MIWYSAARAMRLDFRASSTISGPIPAQSPSVMPMRGFVMLVTVVEPNQLRTSAVRADREVALRCLPKAFGTARPVDQLKCLDVGFFAQAGDPAFLNLLRFLLDEFFLDISAHLGE